jgi:aminoglycoside N3'-acetyltransferase
MIAVGPLAAELVDEHPLGHAFGAGSPLERFVNRDGRVLLLGAPLDAVTVLHYAEAMAAIPNKRRVSYAMPLLDRSGAKVWIRAEDYDSNGILDVFANGAVDAVESIARAYVSERRLPEGRVGLARCRLFDARDLVAFGIRWLESRFGPPST